jgi:hypothetical protein
MARFQGNPANVEKLVYRRLSGSREETATEPLLPGGPAKFFLEIPRANPKFSRFHALIV